MQRCRRSPSALGANRKWRLIAADEDTASKLHLHNREWMWGRVYLREMRIVFSPARRLLTSVFTLAGNFPRAEAESYLFKEIDFPPSRPSVDFTSFQSAVEITLHRLETLIHHSTGFFCFYSPPYTHTLQWCVQRHCEWSAAKWVQLRQWQWTHPVEKAGGK